MLEGSRTLVVDDNGAIRKLIKRVLEPVGGNVTEAESIGEGRSLLEKRGFDLLFLDLFLPDGNGMELLHSLKEEGADIPVVIITGRGTIERAVEAMKAGAFDFLRKPLEHVDLIKVTAIRALDQTRVIRENDQLRKALSSKYSFDRLIGKSPQMEQIIKKAIQVSPSESTVLIEGESGSGKELLARAIHHNSGRAIARFVPVDCGALPENLIESELFGHVKGSFTGAFRDNKGLFREADGGTIFLDEIGELPLPLQAKLLRVLQEREVRPVGATQSIAIDVRVLAATNRDLSTEVKAGRFREDLFYRLNVLQLRLPPLRERTDDIPVLCEHFLRQHSNGNGARPKLSPEAIRKLINYHWPGNVRQLQNCVEQSMALRSGEVIELEDLPDLEGHCVEDAPQKAVEKNEEAPISLEYYEKMAIERALRQCDHEVDDAARLLDVGLSTMYRKMKKHGIPPKRKAMR
jgi:DNA-binding NtrC family response regulator